MIDVKELSVKYDDKLVLNGVSTTFELGKVHGVFGLNGAGKTTFFNSLYGFCKYGGEILLYGTKIKKADIGFLESENFFYRYITGQEYLSIFQSDNSAIFDISALTSILKVNMNELVENYSTGMKKKIALLGILKLNREVYLLDEPFNGIDVESVYFVKEIIQQLKSKGKTVLLSSHIVESLSDLCDDYYVLSNGRFEKFEEKGSFLDYCKHIFDQAAEQIKGTMLP